MSWILIRWDLPVRFIPEVIGIEGIVVAQE